jgi:hypothetical protein
MASENDAAKITTEETMSRIIAAAFTLACFAVAPTLVSAASPIATTDGETSGFRIEVQELKRLSGGTLMLRFMAINDSDQELPSFLFQETSGSHSVDGVYLIDLAGKKKYEVVRDADKLCICSHDIPAVKPKSSLSLWAKFPAPAEGVDKIGIVMPHFIPMDDVPIGK